MKRTIEISKLGFKKFQEKSSSCFEKKIFSAVIFSVVLRVFCVLRLQDVLEQRDTRNQGSVRSKGCLHFQLAPKAIFSWITVGKRNSLFQNKKPNDEVFPAFLKKEKMKRTIEISKLGFKKFFLQKVSGKIKFLL